MFKNEKVFLLLVSTFAFAGQALGEQCNLSEARSILPGIDTSRLVASTDLQRGSLDFAGQFLIGGLEIYETFSFEF